MPTKRQVIIEETLNIAPAPVLPTQEESDANTEAILATIDEQPKKLTGRGGPGRGQGRKAAVNEITNIRQGFYGLIDRDLEAADLQRAWDLLKSVAFQRAYDGDLEDLKWYLNKFIPNADRDTAINIAVGEGGMAPMITISIPERTAGEDEQTKT